MGMKRIIMGNTIFERVVGEITNIGLEHHGKKILDHAKENKKFIKKTIKDVVVNDSPKQNSAIVVSAGPSLHRHDILATIKESDYQGSVVAIDGSYVKCLKSGIEPDYVLTLDPHPTRIVRWFGDPEFEKNAKNDNYFERQDLNVSFRKNSIKENQENIELVNQHACKTKLIICSSAPANIVERAIQAGFDMYWWMPLVDDPSQDTSLTRAMHNVTRLPAMNTGGTVGTAAWVFTQMILKISRIAVVGMDFGYPKSTPYNMTQTYYELIKHLGTDKIDELFTETIYPLTGEVYYTDPTYHWYRENFLSLLEASDSTIFNCSGSGTLVGERVNCIPVDDFIVM